MPEHSPESFPPSVGPRSQRKSGTTLEPTRGNLPAPSCTVPGAPSTLAGPPPA